MTRLVDWAFGLSAIGWAVRGAAKGHAATFVGATIILLNLTAGALFLFRRAAEREASLRDNALCLGSVVMAGVALKVAPPFEAWPPAATVLFSAAGAGAVGSLLTLGKSFAIFPALRRIVGGGPFRLVRHPIYACEMLMVLSCSLAGALTGDPAALGLAALASLLALALLVVRIRIEERLLDASPDYRGYRARVRWRLLPGVW